MRHAASRPPAGRALALALGMTARGARVEPAQGACMAGIRVLVQRRMTFSFPSNFQGNSSVLMPLSLGIDTIGWVSGVLEVILFSKSITGTGATATVSVMNLTTTSDGRLASSQSQTPVASVVIADGNVSPEASPKLYAADFAPPIASQVGVVLQFATSGNSGASGDVQMEVYLVGRDS